MPPAAEKYSQEFNAKNLSAHNRYRNMHGTSPLRLDVSQAEKAQAYANSMNKYGLFKHSSSSARGGCGESIYKLAMSGTLSQNYLATSETMGNDFYTELKNYSFTSNSGSSKTENVTQMLWSGSKTVGFGVAGQYGVVRYCPAGNIAGKYKDNVYPVGG